MVPGRRIRYFVHRTRQPYPEIGILMVVGTKAVSYSVEFTRFSWQRVDPCDELFARLCVALLRVPLGRTKQFVMEKSFNGEVSERRDKKQDERRCNSRPNSAPPNAS